MRAYDLILKKRDNYELSKEEIEFLISEYVAEKIPDYQMSAFLMAVYFNGLTDEETLYMTNAVAHSGDMVDLSAIKGIKVDKHSTGGVGDKTTLIIAPIVASLGVKVAKMSGRGLGHTGGTVDKLESIPNLKTSLSKEEFFEVVNNTGVCVIGQTGNITPADKKLYALRDVTATVDSIPLIAVSVMSKKLAAGSDAILLDIKTGSGAFMKSIDDSIILAEKMVAIGENAGRKTIALITDMDIPLGNNIGNSLEVSEAVDVLLSKGPQDLTEVSLNLAANMLVLANKGTFEECFNMAKEAVKNGTAFNTLVSMIEAQGGDISVIKNTEKFQKAPFSIDVLAEKDGYITHMDTELCGIASSMLGAGRETKDSEIDFSAGIKLVKKVCDKVCKGDVIATMYASKQELFESAYNTFQKAITISDENVVKRPLIFAKVSKNGIERYID